MVGNLGFLHVEGQRLFQAEANHALGFVLVGGQRIEVEQDHPHGRIGQNSDNVTETTRHRADRIIDCLANNFRLQDIGLGQIRYYAAGREFANRASLDHAPGIGDSARQHTVRGNLAGNPGPSVRL